LTCFAVSKLFNPEVRFASGSLVLTQEAGEQKPDEEAYGAGLRWVVG
jgi:hypothetical protein